MKNEVQKPFLTKAIGICFLILLSFICLSASIPAQATDQVEIEFWQSVKDSETADELRVFLDTYPNSVFAPLAQLRLNRLNAGQASDARPSELEPASTVEVPPVPEHRQIGYAGFRIAYVRAQLTEIASPTFHPKFLVTEVFPFGEAIKADLRPDDVVLTINGEHPTSVWNVVRKLQAVMPGAPSRLEVEREGKIIYLQVTSADRFALNWIAAHRGNGVAMTTLADEYRYGLAVEKDRDRAVRWIENAGASNHAFALLRRGLYAEQGFTGEASGQEAQTAALEFYLQAGEAGLGAGYASASNLIAKSDPKRALQLASQALAIDPAQGAAALYLRLTEQNIPSHEGKTQIELLTLAAEYGSNRALRDLGLIYVDGDDSALTPIGVGLIRRAAELGDTVAERELGKLYKAGKGVTRNRTDALAWFMKAAESADGEAQAEVGRAYYFGRGTEKNIDKAFLWFKRASDSNNAIGHFYMAYLTGRGEGTEKDNKLAVEYYHRAAELGHKDAMTNLGIRYQAGRGVAKDMRKAAQWYQRAMEAGALNAHSGVGYMYRHGRGGFPKDPEKAVDVFRAAADRGNASGQYNLGLMYEAGEGVHRDIDEAVRLFRLAAGREKRAKKALERLDLPLFDSAEIQQLLSDLGYEPGPIDGKPAARTSAAVRAFQDDQNIDADGKLDLALLGQLRKEAKSRETTNVENSQVASAVGAISPGQLTPDQEKIFERLENELDF